MARAVSCVAETGCTLGEGPVWDHARQCLWFVDIKQEQLLHLDPASNAIARYAAPGQIGWVIPATDGRLVAGLQNGLYWFDPERGRFSFWMEVPGEPATNRLNDACSDDEGRIWFGSMDDGEDAVSGRFYVLERGTIVPRGPAPISITNGPAVAAARGRIYFTDTLGGTMSVADLDRSGAVGEARLLATIPEAEGYPDGPVVDSKGCIWTGVWAGDGPRRYSAEGVLLETVAMPVRNVTKIALGGADFRTAYVTTARKGLDAEALAAQPLAGGLFSFRVDVAGTPVTPYAL